MNIELIVRDDNTVGIELSLDLRKQEEMNIPVIGALAPNTDGQINRASGKLPDFNKRLWCLINRLPCFTDRKNDAARSFGIRFIGNRNNKVNPAVILDRSIRFDPEVGEFDFYDSDLSMQATMSGLKLGVVVRKDLSHFSVGKSILTPHFLENELKFRKKWNLPLPPNLMKMEANKQIQLNGSAQAQELVASSSYVDAVVPSSITPGPLSV